MYMDHNLFYPSLFARLSQALCSTLSLTGRFVWFIVPKEKNSLNVAHVTHDQELAVPVLHQAQCNTKPLNGANQRMALGMRLSPCPTGS